MLDLSIILPTCNRAALLEKALASIASSVRCSHEIIVVDGASNDRTGDVLNHARHQLGDRLRIIREEQREGFVKATNRGFRSATGKYMTWLNDDARPLHGALDLAVQQLESAEPTVAFVAMFHRWHSTKNVAYETEHGGRMYRLCHVRGTLYANFPVGRRDMYEKLNYFDERYFVCAADPDLSLKAWHAGLRIVPAYGALIDHDEVFDDRRNSDSRFAEQDNQRLFDKWDLPDRNPRRNDFDPTHPCTLRGLRDQSAIAAQVNRMTTIPNANLLVSFVLSTHNRRKELHNTLASLYLCGLTKEAFEIFVIDNASKDGTAEAIRRDFPQVIVLEQKKNRGSCAKNAALPLARGRYVVFLDDDSYPRYGSIGRMIRHFETDPDLGAAVFSVHLPDGSSECSAYPDVFIGCGTGFRRKALAEVGGLPEDFFMQAEEYDLSLRLLDAGWTLKRFDDLHVVHLKSSTARRPNRVMRLDVRNNLILARRYFPQHWIKLFERDWMTRYYKIAAARNQRLSFFAGAVQGFVASRIKRDRKPISNAAFEAFAKIKEIRSRLAIAQRVLDLKSVIFVDLGKNVLAYWMAARDLGIDVVVIADQKLAAPAGKRARKYRGIPIVNDDEAQTYAADAVLIANLSPVHAKARRREWRAIAHRPVIDLFELDQPWTDDLEFSNPITDAVPAASGFRQTVARSA